MWEPFVRRVTAWHGFSCHRIVAGLPGTFPTFIVELESRSDSSALDRIVVKFFGPLFEGETGCEVEREMSIFVAQHPLSIRSPAILAQGKLTLEWSYLVYEHIPGVSVGQVRQELSAEAMKKIARQMGRFMKELHTLTSDNVPSTRPSNALFTSEGYLRFLETQRLNCYANHQQWQDLPPHLLQQIPDFISPVEELVDRTSPLHLIHSDLTADHLLGRLTSFHQAAGKMNSGRAKVRPGAEWESLAVIDWGDCRVGNILYELVALHIDLFRIDKLLLQQCLKEYDLPVFYQQDFAHKALSMALLHQFPLPEYFFAIVPDLHSLHELAERLYGW